jgi:hypothetical protein
MGFELLIFIFKTAYRTRRALKKDVTEKNIIIAAYASGSAIVQWDIPVRHDRTAEVIDANANTAKMAPVAS